MNGTFWTCPGSNWWGAPSLPLGMPCSWWLSRHVCVSKVAKGSSSEATNLPAVFLVSQVRRRPYTALWSSTGSSYHCAPAAEIRPAGAGSSVWCGHAQPTQNQELLKDEDCKAVPDSEHNMSKNESTILYRLNLWPSRISSTTIATYCCRCSALYNGSKLLTWHHLTRETKPCQQIDCQPSDH